MKILQLNHVALHVSDLAASCRFYEQVLGVTQIDRPAFDFAGAWYELSPATPQAPRQELHLIARPRPDLPAQDLVPVLGHPDQVHLDVVHRVRAFAVLSGHHPKLSPNALTDKKCPLKRFRLKAKVSTGNMEQ